MILVLFVLVLVSIISNSIAFRSNAIVRSIRLPSISNKISMFSNGGGSVEDKKVEETAVEKKDIVEESKNDDIITNIGFRVQDLLTIGLIGWTIYLVGDSIRIVAFPPPQI